MILIYVLSLRGGYFYVGTTFSSNISYSINKHLSGYENEWTKIHKPLALVKQIACITGINPRLQEDLHVKQLMIDHGIDKVRGGSYSDVVLSVDQRVLLEKELQYAKKYQGPAQVSKCRLQNENKRPAPPVITSRNSVSFPTLIEHYYLAANALINSNYFDNRTNDCIKATLSIIEITDMKIKGNTVLTTGSCASISSSSFSSTLMPSKTEEEEKGISSSLAVNTSLDTIPTVSSDSSRSHESMSIKFIENSENVTSKQNIPQTIYDRQTPDIFCLASEPCTRCGRRSHHRSRCYETVDIHGFDLSDFF